VKLYPIYIVACNTLDWIRLPHVEKDGNQLDISKYAVTGESGSFSFGT